MKCKIIKLLSVFFVLLVFVLQTNVKAQKKWSLEDCIKHALENNLQIKQSELNAEVNKAALLQSKLKMLPDVNANSSQSFNYGKTVDRYTNQFATERVRSDNYYLQSGVTLFSGFSNLNTVKENEYNCLASRYDAQKMKDDISLNISLAYLQILFNEELVLVAQNQIGITKEQIARTEKLVDAGTLARGSLLQLKSQLASEELQYINSKNQLDLSYLSLSQMLDLPSVNGFAVERPEINVAENAMITAADSIYSIALTWQPSIKSAEYRYKSSERGLYVAKGGLSPVVQLRGSYGTGYSGVKNMFEPVTKTWYANSFKDQINDNLNKSIGISVSIPLFNGYQVRTSINRAKINMLNAQINVDIQKLQLQKTIQQAYADAQAALKKYEATSISVETLQELFNYSQQRFDVGLVNITDFNLAKNNLLKAQSDKLQAKYDYVFRLKVLDFYQGKPISLK